MVPIGDRPILWHLMKYFAHFDLRDFVICTGYRGDFIRQYFRDFATINSDFTLKLGSNSLPKFHSSVDEADWEVTVANTGLETMTGGRVFKVKDYVGSETFICTYGDGLSNIDINELIKFHKSHGKIATVSAVRPLSRFGVLDLDNSGQVNSFLEKPQSSGWINAGYFVFEKEIFDYLEADSILEREPMTNLANDGQLMAFKHEGFFQPMDTYREMTILNELWRSNVAPWKVWK
jgi:glucose-1-phosphate cytidylyltransferase